MLNLQPNIAAPDEFYEALIAAHRGLTPAESARVNAKLILLLANQIGDAAVLHAALAKAREGVAAAAPERRPDADTPP
jgi:hypothetical protein